MRLLASWLTQALLFALLPRQALAADRDAALHQALGSLDPLYKFSPAALAAAVKLCASRDPDHAGVYIALVLNSGRNDADAIAPSLVRAAIQGLGPDPVPSLVAAIVRYAVTATPSEVLDIVTAAVKASPRETAPDIVTAAVSSVPHPEQMVTVNVQRRAERLIGNDKELDAKQLAAPAQKQLTLAEAIVQAALDADPGLSEQSLTAAVDGGLNTGIEVNRPTILTEVLPPVSPILPEPPVTPVRLIAPGPVSP